MHRCVHIYDSGLQCVSEALESSDFCEIHQKVVAFELLQDSPIRKLFVRVVAFILLLAFLIPMFNTLRNLASPPRTQMRGAW